MQKGKSSVLRVLGIELGGSKSSRTSLVGLEYFIPQEKIFVRYYKAHLKAEKHRSGDEVLVDFIKKRSPELLGVNAPLSMPPFFQSSKSKNMKRLEELSSVRWMYKEARSKKDLKLPTHYTQRPIDIFLRTRIQPSFSLDLHLEETLGSARAPLAARMQYLQSILPNYSFLETNPRLTLISLSRWFSISPRDLRNYKSIELGVVCRLRILEAMEQDMKKWKIPQVFLYESDKLTISRNLDLFYAFLNALVVSYSKNNLLLEPTKDFCMEWGFLAIPKSLEEVKKRNLVK